MQTLFTFQKNTYFVTSLYIYIHIHMYTLYPHRQGGAHAIKIQGGRVVDSVHSFFVGCGLENLQRFSKSIAAAKKELETVAS